jgi:3-phosphoshikimate 1-carboxyvinyltransferase
MAGGLNGSLTAPPDKSISHRAALFAAMCEEPVAISGYLEAADTAATLAAVEAVGGRVERRGAELVVHGVGMRAAREPVSGVIDVGNAGTLLRLLPGWLAGQPGRAWTLDGDESIRRRPVDRIAAPLARMGAELEARDGRLPPLTVRGVELTGVDHELPVASAQVKSCLLMAGLLAADATSVTEPAPSRDHTERLLARAGVRMRRTGLTTRVRPVEVLELDRLTVPGDPSSAAFWVAAACLVPGSQVRIDGVGLNWTRTGFLRIAKRMGARLEGPLESRPGAGEVASADEPVGTLIVSSGPLQGTAVTSEEVPLAIDELALVALLGCFAEGETVVSGAEELRLKESDRIAGVVEGLRGLGAQIEGTPGGFAVKGTGELRGGILHSRGDHRMAMLGAVAGLASRDGVEVVGMEAAGVSYPGFEADLAVLG